MKALRRYGITAAAVLLLVGCSGMTGTVEPPAEDPRAALMGVWKGGAEAQGVTVRTSLSFNASRFVIVYTVERGDDYHTEVVSGSWEATATEVTGTWIDRRTLEKKTKTVTYTLASHEDLTIQPLVSVEGYPDVPMINLRLQTPWTAADFADTWQETWWNDDWTRSFELTYDASGTCSWRDRYDHHDEDWRDSLTFLQGTCELNISEHFLFMTVTKAEQTRRQEATEGLTLRFAFARGIGPEIIVSTFDAEMQYDPLAGAWVSNTRFPHGAYWLWMNR